MNRKMSISMAACLIALAGCGQSEQATERGGQQSSKTAESGPVTGNQPSDGKVYEGTISGVISDSMCKSDHSGMGELGKDPVACTQKARG